MFHPIIALTTDFGQADGYVGTMKGIILGICPQATLVDISHEIRPQAVHQAAFVLAAAVPYFPPGTVHLVVVDPGVGGPRRALVVQTERATFVAPDNGVLGQTLAADPARLAVQLTAERFRLPQVSATFHGRDIFAPAAAHLACSADPRAMGEAVALSSLVTLPELRPRPAGKDSWLGEVVHVDRFGNLVTSFRMQVSSPEACTASIAVTVQGQRIQGLSRTYGDVAPGEWVAYAGSSDYLEIALRDGNAAARLGVEIGAPVQIEGCDITDGGVKWKGSS